MTANRYAVTLSALECGAHVPVPEQVEEHVEPRPDVSAELIPFVVGGPAAGGGAVCGDGDC